MYVIKADSMDKFASINSYSQVEWVDTAKEATVFQSLKELADKPDYIQIHGFDAIKVTDGDND